MQSLFETEKAFQALLKVKISRKIEQITNLL